MHYGLSKTISKKDKRHPKWKQQRKERGFDDTELWALDSTLTKFILPRLKMFQEKRCGYPGSLTEKKWSRILDDMIAGFEEHSKYDGVGSSVDHDKIDKALKLFAKWYMALWS